MKLDGARQTSVFKNELYCGVNRTKLVASDLIFKRIPIAINSQEFNQVKKSFILSQVMLIKN